MSTSASQLLFVDCCLRGAASRTAKVAEAFLSGLQPHWQVTRLVLEQEPLQPLQGDFFAQRELLLQQGRLDHPRFRYAHQFAEADAVVIAAPLWDLSFPALVKIYIENLCVDGITFGCSDLGLHGLCKGRDLIFLTTRGGFYDGSPFEQGSRYLEAMKDFFGFRHYHCIAADGMDTGDAGALARLNDACRSAAALAGSL